VKIAQLLHTNTSIRTLDLTCEFLPHMNWAHVRMRLDFSSPRTSSLPLTWTLSCVVTANAVEDIGATALAQAIANNTSLVKLVSLQAMHRFLARGVCTESDRNIGFRGNCLDRDGVGACGTKGEKISPA
jgi:hypothetical protein